jgi:hypothetical protein
MASNSKVFDHTSAAVSTTHWRPLARQPFNFHIYGNGVGTIKVEKSYDNGSTWLDVSKDANGTLASWVKATGDEIALIMYEVEEGTLWRSNCTAFTSGTLTTRFSQ